MIATGIKPVDHKDIPEYMAFICYDESFSCFVILSGFARSILFEYSSDGKCLSVRAPRPRGSLTKFAPGGFHPSDWTVLLWIHHILVFTLKFHIEIIYNNRMKSVGTRQDTYF